MLSKPKEYFNAFDNNIKVTVQSVGYASCKSDYVLNNFSTTNIENLVSDRQLTLVVKV